MSYNNKKIKIAFIDDDEDDFLLMQECLKFTEGISTLDWFNSYEEALPHIISEEYDIYFLDYFLGRKTGIEILQEAKKLKVNRPLVLLTGVGNREIDILAMKYGATDYMIKADLTTEKVERCIRYSLQRTVFMEEIKTREKKYYTLFEGSRDAVFIADKDLTLIEFNFSTQQLLDIKNDPAPGISLYDFIAEPAQKDNIRELIRKNGKIDELEITLLNEEPEPKVCILSLHVLEDDLLHGIIHDISKFKKAEQANLLSEKMQANDRLLRVLAHEIRNPLCNINLSTEMLLSEIENESQLSLLKIMERNTRRINDIIGELVGLTNPGELVLESVPLQDILEESLSRTTDRMFLQKVVVEKNYHPDPILVNMDKKKMIMAFTNILINAVEAMETGKGKLSIAVSKHGENITVSIKDNGRGIPKEFLSKLFEPLFTLKQKGMGLGLTATYSIIKAHNGKLMVESTEGEGSVFSITFDQHQVPLPADV